MLQLKKKEEKSAVFVVTVAIIWDKGLCDIGSQYESILSLFLSDF